jgi:hypothetical protein
MTVVKAVTANIKTAKLAEANQWTPIKLLQFSHRASPKSRPVTGSVRSEHFGQFLRFTFDA